MQNGAATEKLSENCGEPDPTNVYPEHEDDRGYSGTKWSSMLSSNREESRNMLNELQCRHIMLVHERKTSKELLNIIMKKLQTVSQTKNYRLSKRVTSRLNRAEEK